MDFQSGVQMVDQLVVQKVDQSAEPKAAKMHLWALEMVLDWAKKIEQRYQQAGH